MKKTYTKAELILKANKECIKLRKLGAKHDKALKPAREAYSAANKKYNEEYNRTGHSDTGAYQKAFKAYWDVRNIFIDGKKTECTKICQSSPVFKVGEEVKPAGRETSTKYYFVTPGRWGNVGGYFLINGKTGKLCRYGMITSLEK